MMINLWVKLPQLLWQLMLNTIQMLPDWHLRSLRPQSLNTYHSAPIFWMWQPMILMGYVFIIAEWRIFTNLEYLSSPPVFNGVHVAHSFVFCGFFYDHYLSFVLFLLAIVLSVIYNSKIYFSLCSPVKKLPKNNILTKYWYLSSCLLHIYIWEPSWPWSYGSYLQLPMPSVPITTDVVSSNLNQGEVYNIMW